VLTAYFCAKILRKERLLIVNCVKIKKDTKTGEGRIIIKRFEFRDNPLSVVMAG
jgi:hypothetical protein